MTSRDGKRTVLIADDAPVIVASINSLLLGEYNTKIATSGEKVLAMVRSGVHPDLLLLDIMLPGIDGYQVCSLLKADHATRDIPIIFLTGKKDPEDQVKGFEMGAVDYITKPIYPPILLARIKTQLALTEAREVLLRQNQLLEAEVLQRTHEVYQVQEATMMALGSLAETRDSETGDHIRRTQQYVKSLALKLQAHPRFHSYLSDRRIEALFRAAALHDIGKVGIPDRILLKPGPLTAEEFEVMKSHTRIGRDAILAAEVRLDRRSDFLALGREIAYSHHERWDGSGYPEGQVGEAIPISARLMAVADVYDAIISKRVYKDPMTHQKAVELIQSARDTQFDPDVVDAFVELADEFRQIAVEYSDSTEELARRARLGDLWPPTPDYKDASLTPERTGTLEV